MDYIHADGIKNKMDLQKINIYDKILQHSIIKHIYIYIYMRKKERLCILICMHKHTLTYAFIDREIFWKKTQETANNAYFWRIR
jgi:hypothetical protein